MLTQGNRLVTRVKVIDQLPTIHDRGNFERKAAQMPDHVSEPLRIGGEISVTGKWVPKTFGGLFRKSPDADGLLKE